MLTVKLRVKRRVVVHFELVIDGETPAACADLGEEFIKGAGKISALADDSRQFLFTCLLVLGGSVVAFRLFAHVKFLQGENREPVDDHTGCFGIKRNTGFRRFQFCYEHLVHRFDEVVALLIETVDRPFRLINAFETDVVATGDVFLVPKLEVPKMVLLDEPKKNFAARGRVGLMPIGRQTRLEIDDLLRINLHRGLCCPKRNRRQAFLFMSHPVKTLDLRSLLILKPSSLGDIVHGLQLAQTVAKQLPNCRITWVARDRFALLPEAAPFVHEVIPFRRRDGISALFELLQILRRRKWDAVWDMQGLLRTGLMTLAARSPEKWGRRDAREGARLFYNRRIDLPPGEGPHHALAVLQGFARSFGLADEITYPLDLRRGPEFSWEPFFKGDPGKQFVIFTDSRGVEKEWKGFEELTRLLWERIPGSRVAWCAGQKTEFPGAPKGRFLNLTGCPLDEMVELVRQPSVFIGNDSGPMHLSAALGNQVLAIFGPTSSKRFGPWPLDSQRNHCVVAPSGNLAALKAETVLKAVIELTRESTKS